MATSDTETPDQSAEESAGEATDTRAKFAEALRRKQAAGQARSQHLDGDNHVHGSTRSAGGKREFRRKSG